MSKLRIKYFGPIKEGYQDNDGWLEVKKVTVFIGNQGSGKSTLAKVITTMTWLEKAINRGDIKVTEILSNQFRDYFRYMLTHNYFSKNTEIEYQGDVMHCLFNNKNSSPVINIEHNIDYKVPKVMYIPSERNLLSVLQNPYLLKELPESLITFAQELRKSHLALNSELVKLPLQGMQFKYDKKNEKAILIGENYELGINESSSGYHSMVPLYLVSKFLCDEIEKGPEILREQLSAEQSIRRNKEVSDVSFNPKLSTKEKEDLITNINSKYLNTCFINVVEEPEQNLFPSSQQKLLYSLIDFANRSEANKLIITTHSPYLINYLTLAVKAKMVMENLVSSDSKEKLSNILPIASLLKGNDLVIYELNEVNGTIGILPQYKGLPSDENYLNASLDDSNEIFTQLQEIEKGWR